MDRDVALEALGVFCNAKVIRQKEEDDNLLGLVSAVASLFYGSPVLSVINFISTVFDAQQTSPASVIRNQKYLSLDEDEFFDPTFDYDFTNVSDTKTFYRSGEVYERPSGWYRCAIKVLDKYDDNKWLGNQYRSTRSVPGEWPVSYHGTSLSGAEGIIKDHYKPGEGQAHGRGIYSTPYIKEAVPYAKTFTSTKDGRTYQVILQNRINPKYREKHKDDKYWLVRIPDGKSDTEVKEIVNKAIRPYGLLLKKV